MSVDGNIRELLARTKKVRSAGSCGQDLLKLSSSLRDPKPTFAAASAASYDSRCTPLERVCPDRSIPHKLPHRHFPLRSKAGKDVTLVIGREFFRRSDRRIGQRNEREHFAIPDASNANALIEAGIGFVVGLRIGDIDRIVVVDVEAAWPAKLFPFSDEIPALIKNLNAAVGTIADIEPTCRIHRQTVRNVEFAGSRAVFSPSCDEGAIYREFHDAI